MGWFVGHFIDPSDALRSTDAVEVKWGIHPAGEEKAVWTQARTATSLSLLIQGKFRLIFPQEEIVLAHQGDYAIWLPNVFHTWRSEEDSIVLTLRWPSRPDDVIVADDAQLQELERRRSR